MAGARYRRRLALRPLGHYCRPPKWRRGGGVDPPSQEEGEVLRRVVSVAAATLAAVAVSAPAQAADRLQAYKVQLDKPGQLQKLAENGFDVHEGVRGRSIEIVATPT